jgi:ribonuclease HI
MLLKPGPDQKTALILARPFKKLNTRTLPLMVQWVPDHIAVDGNGTADALGKAAAKKTTRLGDSTTTLSCIKRAASGQMVCKWQATHLYPTV